MFERWFHSEAERKLRAACHIDFGALDELEADLKKHLAAVQQDDSAESTDDDND